MKTQPLYNPYPVNPPRFKRFLKKALSVIGLLFAVMAACSVENPDPNYVGYDDTLGALILALSALLFMVLASLIRDRG